MIERRHQSTVLSHQILSFCLMSGVWCLTIEK